MTSSYYGNLGFTYPFALGAKVAQPERAVVAVSGDGGFLFNSQELSTAVKYGINAVVVVFNDGAFGNVLRGPKNEVRGAYYRRRAAQPGLREAGGGHTAPAAFECTAPMRWSRPSWRPWTSTRRRSSRSPSDRCHPPFSLSSFLQSTMVSLVGTPYVQKAARTAGSAERRLPDTKNPSWPGPARACYGQTVRGMLASGFSALC